MLLAVFGVALGILSAIDAGWLYPSEVREIEGYKPSPELDNKFLQSKLQAQPAN
jgi:hypothetical protein